jgi:hypothetical protein
LSDSVQTEAPVAQTILPMRQGFAAMAQVVPTAHTAQLPSLQTEPSSQTLPFDFSRRVSVHVVAPAAEHAVSPS